MLRFKGNPQSAALQQKQHLSITLVCQDLCLHLQPKSAVSSFLEGVSGSSIVSAAHSLSSPLHWASRDMTVPLGLCFT